MDYLEEPPKVAMPLKLVWIPRANSETNIGNSMRKTLGVDAARHMPTSSSFTVVFLNSARCVPSWRMIFFGEMINANARRLAEVMIATKIAYTEVGTLGFALWKLIANVTMAPTMAPPLSIVCCQKMYYGGG
jgi:hypothetical protein